MDAQGEAESAAHRTVLKRSIRKRRLYPRLLKAFAIGICVLLGIIVLRKPWRVTQLRLIGKWKTQIVSATFVGPPGIVLHCSESPAKFNGVAMNAKRLEEIHMEEHASWATRYQGKVYHIGYHFVILPNGKVETGRPIGCIGAHARMYNDWIGICMIGAFGGRHEWWPRRPTAAQMKSVTALCERLMSQYHIPPEYVKRHKDINDTDCPGSRFPYASLMVKLKQYAMAHPETLPLTGRVVKLVIPHRHQHRVYASRMDQPLHPTPPAHSPVVRH